jgi:hypothetical protein
MLHAFSNVGQLEALYKAAAIGVTSVLQPQLVPFVALTPDDVLSASALSGIAYVTPIAPLAALYDAAAAAAIAPRVIGHDPVAAVAKRLGL